MAENGFATRHEVDAKITQIESRVEVRVGALTHKIELYLTEARERDKRVELMMQTALRAAEQTSDLKRQMWAAALTVVLSVMAASIAIRASNDSMFQMSKDIFTAGQLSSSPDRKTSSTSGLPGGGQSRPPEPSLPDLSPKSSSGGTPAETSSGRTPFVSTPGSGLGGTPERSTKNPGTKP